MILLISGCASNPVNEILGKWSMHKVIQDEKDVTEEHNPYDERFLIMREGSTFESSGRPFGRNTGSYVFDQNNHTLFLDSDAGTEDDSQWKITIEGDTMHWLGHGSEWAKGFEIIHIKTE